MSKKNKPITEHSVKSSSKSKGSESARNTERNTLSVLPLAYSQRNFYIVLGLIVIPCLIAYFPGFQNDFVWDDYFYIVNNPFVQQISWDSLKVNLTGYVLGNYHPLTMLSYWLEYQVAGRNAWVYHLTNLLIHLVNSWLVYRLIYRLNGGFLVAAVTSVLFAIHPLHVESVVWAAERKDVLYTLFFLLSFGAYLRYVEANRMNKHYWLAFLFFVLSCLSKGMAVVLPVVLLLTDYLFLNRRLTFSLVIEKLPFFAVALATGIVSIMAQRSIGADATTVMNQAYSLSERLVLVGYGLFFYWSKMVAPFGIMAFYPYPAIINHQIPSFYYGGFGLLLLLIVGLYLLGRKNKQVWWGAGYFFIVILPVSQLLPIGSALMADRYFYVSSIGSLFLLGLLAHYLYSKGGATQRLLPVLGVGILVLFTFLSFQRAQTWKNPYTLFSDILKKHPNDPMVLSNIGWYYYGQRDTLNAITYFEKTLAQDFSTADIHEILGQIYFDKKEYAKSIQNFEKAIEKKPDEMKKLYWMLATGYYYTNAIDKSIEAANKALALDPKNANAHNVLGLCDSKLEKYPEAQSHYLTAIKLQPSFSDPYINVSHIHHRLGQYDQEVDYLLKAIKANPKATLAYKNLGVSYIAQNQPEKAIEYWKKGIQADPKDGSFDYNIGLRYGMQGNVAEAIKWYQQAARKGDTNAIEFLKARNVSF
ncbi:MAG: tetratricopeptide repeat protein [Spirosomataceae bacterium]